MLYISSTETASSLNCSSSLPIARVEWIQRNVFDIGGSSKSERIGKHLKRRRGEGVETENSSGVTLKGCNTSGAEETCKN